MKGKLERNRDITQEQAILAKTFTRFYEKNDHFFSNQDKVVAKNYFHATGENISPEMLLERQKKCIEICERAVNFAARQRKEFFGLLRSLPIAFDRKDILRTQFLNGDFQVKAQLVEYLHQEEKRITLKREAQKAVIESLKNQFTAFYGDNAIYFNEHDRELAITYVLTSINGFRTHIGRLGRLHMLLAMLPANLAYAKELDEKYQTLLLQKIPGDSERDRMLEKFRNGNFAHKNELLKTLGELVIVREKKEDPEISLKATLLQKYKELHSEFPSGTNPENFSVLSLTEQKSTLAQKQESNIRERDLLQAKEKVTTESSPTTAARLEEKEKKSSPTHSMCEIAMRIIKNERGKKYHDDKEIIADIETQMKHGNISGTFSEANLIEMRRILPRLPEQYWGTSSAALWVKRELQNRSIVHEYN
ncbi:MAG: hypothetical protein A2V81_01515 [Candidatus Abawacabacteria bacterium RBG_16_42_10]|uniref:Uncharacterized protein n=1 Tax=Candidatus Abawacabacteria bacterium RBG_16_42_10 TaxID=1817814 RepID=A0A1F4XKL0_9BACT|nr:MAG: hypothetical protein A2V81_01515 [Candidatus Abawacabacteria bacterium RBG_16_42_10]